MGGRKFWIYDYMRSYNDSDGYIYIFIKFYVLMDSFLYDSII